MTSRRKGWTTVAFGDVVRLNKERAQDPLTEGLDRYVGLQHLEPGDLKIRRWGNVADGTTFTNVFHPGQVLFGKRRAYQRKVAVADCSGVCSGDIYVLTPKDDRLLPELLPFICQTDAFFDHAIGTSAGSLSPRTNWKSLASYEFALPPLEEQRRIAGALNAVVEASEHYRALAETARQSQVALVLGIGKQAETSSPSTVSRIDELCECLDSQRIPLNDAERSEIPGDIPYYGATGQVDSIGRHIFDEDLILVAEDGGPFDQFIDKPIAYRISGKSWVNNHAHVLRPKNESFADWIFLNLVHRDLRPYTTGSTRGKLNKAELLNVPVWMPERGERDRLAELFGGFDRVRSRCQLRATQVGDLEGKIAQALVNGSDSASRPVR